MTKSTRPIAIFLFTAIAAVVPPQDAYADQEAKVPEVILARDYVHTQSGRMPTICIFDHDTGRTGIAGYVLSFPLLIDEILKKDGQASRFSQGFLAQHSGAKDMAALSILALSAPPDPSAISNSANAKTEEAEDDGFMPYPPPGAKGDSKSRPNQTQAAARAYKILTRFIAQHVWPYDTHDITDSRDTQRFVLVGPNGVNVRLAFDETGKGSKPVSTETRAQQLVARILKGQKYQIACKILYLTEKEHDDAEKSRPESSRNRWPGEKFPDFTQPSLTNIHLAASRDDLMLSSYPARDQLSSGATISVQPGTKTTQNPSPPATYTVIGALGYTVADSRCDYRQTGCIAASATPFLDAYYGSDKNLPKSVTLPAGADNRIDRVGLGTTFALRDDPSSKKWNIFSGEQPIGVLVQVIPEFITDTHFIGKEAYAELRIDLIDAPGLFCFGNEDQEIGPFDMACGLAGIADYSHSFRPSRESFKLYSNYFRLGGEAGVTATPDSANKLSLGAWYRVVEDLTDSGATAHNFTTTLGYKFGDDGDGKTVSLAFSYTDGEEDLTLFPLPTWNVAIKAGL